MTLSAEQMFLTYKRIHPESDAVIATLAAAIYHHATDNMKLPYNADCQIFIRDGLEQRTLYREPFGKKFNELTGLTTHGVNSLPPPPEIDPDDPAYNSILDKIRGSAEDDLINETSEAIADARASSLGMGIKEQEAFLKFMMEAPLDGQTSRTFLEIMTDLINDAVAISILNDRYREEQQKRYDGSTSELSGEFLKLVRKTYPNFSLELHMKPENFLDDAVYDISGELVKNIFSCMDTLDKRKRGLVQSDPALGPEAPHT